VNFSVLVLRRRPVSHDHYRAPTICPILGLISCAYLVSPWSGRDPQQYKIAGVLLAIGAVLFAVIWALHGRKPAALRADNLTKS
jgi:basic amino acid/polyamine antiporter, APA family